MPAFDERAGLVAAREIVDRAENKTDASSVGLFERGRRLLSRQVVHAAEELHSLCTAGAVKVVT